MILKIRLTNQRDNVLPLLGLASKASSGRAVLLGGKLWTRRAQLESGAAKLKLDILYPKKSEFFSLPHPNLSHWPSEFLRFKIEQALNYCLKMADTDQNGTLDFEASHRNLHGK